MIFDDIDEMTDDRDVQESHMKDVIFCLYFWEMGVHRDLENNRCKAIDYMLSREDYTEEMYIDLTGDVSINETLKKLYLYRMKFGMVYMLYKATLRKMFPSGEITYDIDKDQFQAWDETYSDTISSDAFTLYDALKMHRDYCKTHLNSWGSDNVQ